MNIRGFITAAVWARSRGDDCVFLDRAEIRSLLADFIGSGAAVFGTIAGISAVDGLTELSALDVGVVAAVCQTPVCVVTPSSRLWAMSPHGRLARAGWSPRAEDSDGEA